ncbi:MAG: DNA repair protein RecO [Clostridia bacterium]|nr:DNA repair protein RecO [Clostridia bacterium]
MVIQTDALVLREQNIGENDRLITLLTRNSGIVKAFVKVAGKAKSGLQSATQLLCYSRFTIQIGRTANRIKEAEAIEVYFGLRQDIEKVALAQYFTQLVAEAAPEGNQSDELLRIMLNALYFLHNGKKKAEQLKAIVEFRVACMCGYMPSLECCDVCGETQGERYIFDYINGVICCAECKGNQNGAYSVISDGVLSALRYIIDSDISKLFSFNMSDEGFKVLSDVTERYIITQLQRSFSALDFYNSVKEL